MELSRLSIWERSAMGNQQMNTVCSYLVKDSSGPYHYGLRKHLGRISRREQH
ncbi:hypothetical protein ACEQPO_07700 [Bacillus sp. SL00103]